MSEAGRPSGRKPHPEKSLRFARNVSWNVVGQLGAAGVNFFILPFVIRRLGTEAYGLYLIMNAATSYLMMAAFGAGGSTIRYSASALSARDGAGARRVLRLSLSMHLLGVGAAGAALFAFAPTVALRLFHVPGPLLPTAAFMLRAAAAGALGYASWQSFHAFLTGGQKFSYTSGLQFFHSALMPIGIALLVTAGHGLRAIACWYVALNLCVALAALIAARAALRAHDGTGSSERPPLRTFLDWSLRSWLGPLAWIISNQVDKVFIARAMSLTAVTLYAVPVGLLQRLQIIPGSVSVVIIPMMTELKGEGSEEQLRRMYLKGLRFILWVMLPILSLLFVFMPQFLGLWLHGDFRSVSVWPARLIVMAQLASLAVAMPNTAAFSRDKPLYISAIAWAQALLSLALWRLLVPRYHLLGVALGTLLAQSLPSIFYLAHVHKLLGIRARRYLTEGFGAPALSCLLTVAALLPLHQRASTWPRLAGLAALGYLVFYASTWLLIGREDRELGLLVLRKVPVLGPLL